MLCMQGRRSWNQGLQKVEKAKRELEKQEGNVAVLSFGTKESAEVVIWEINKTEQYTASTYQSGEYVKRRE